MRALVLCVVIEIVSASANIDQSQYPNDENQIRRFQFSYYLPLIPTARQYYQNRLYNGLSIGPLHPQSNAFIYNSRPIVPYLMERVNNLYTNEELRRILLYIIGRNINSFTFTKVPNMLNNSKRILNQFLLKELIYKLQNSNIEINEIRNFIIKMLQGQGNNDFINPYIKKHEGGFIKFTTNKIKESGSYQEVQHNSTGLPLNVLEIENPNKQIQHNITKAKSTNNNGVPDKNNQNNSTILIKTFHINFGGNVSNLEPKSIIKNNEHKALSNVTVIKSSSKVNISTNMSKEIGNKGNIEIGENNTLNKDKDSQRIKLLSGQSDNSKFSAKDYIILNFLEKNDTEHGTESANDYMLPTDRHHLDSKNYFLSKNNHDLSKKLPERTYNIQKTLVYHNLHPISQGTHYFAKTDYNNESINRKPAFENINQKTQNKVYQIEKFRIIENHTRHVENSSKTSNQDMRDIVTQNPLSNHRSTIDQNKKTQYEVPLEFEIEDLSENGIPYYSQEIAEPKKSNNKDKESPSRVEVKRNLLSGKGSDQKDCHTKKDREDEKSMEVENINENYLHKITNLQGNLLIDSMKPIEITTTHKKTVKETKTITFSNQSELYSKNPNNKKPNVMPKNVDELFFLKDYDSPPPVKKVVVTVHETSDEIKITNNNGKSNLMDVILNNLSLSNLKNCKNNNSNKKRRVNDHIYFIKSVKDQSDLKHGKVPTLVFENDYDQYKEAKRYKAKNNLCRDCKQNDNTQTFQNLDGIPKELVQSTVHSTTFNENMKAKNNENKNPAWNQNASEKLYQNNKYHHNEALPDEI